MNRPVQAHVPSRPATTGGRISPLATPILIHDLSTRLRLQFSNISHCSFCIRVSDPRNTAILAASFDPLVTVPVETGKVMPQITVLWVDRLLLVLVHAGESRKFLGQSSERGSVELVLVRLRAQLGGTR